MHTAILAVSTGMGLVFMGGVVGAASWVAFAAATAIGVSVAAWWIRRHWVSRDETTKVLDAHPGAHDVEPTTRAVKAEVATQRRSPLGWDDIDYLRALRHEFRTPLNAVLGFSDVLLSGIDGEISTSQREDLEIIRASGIRLRVLLDSALDISQLAEGDFRIDTERVDAREVVSRAVADAVQLWSNKRQARCTVPDGPCTTMGDEARLRRSILVLADFLAATHRDAEICVCLARSADHLDIELTAEPSEGQSLDTLPSVAEVLGAEDVARIRQWPVAVTSELIARHDGSLYHGSTPSRFLIRLPVADAV